MPVYADGLILSGLIQGEPLMQLILTAGCNNRFTEVVEDC